MHDSDVEVVLKNVTKKFGDFVAVKDFNLEIRKGEYITFLGPSGCGKTTTLRMIAGHEEATSGDIYIQNHRVNDLDPVERGTTMMFQNFALFPHKNIYDNIEFGPRRVLSESPRCRARTSCPEGDCSPRAREPT